MKGEERLAIEAQKETLSLRRSQPSLKANISRYYFLPVDQALCSVTQRRLDKLHSKRLGSILTIFGDDFRDALRLFRFISAVFDLLNLFKILACGQWMQNRKIAVVKKMGCS